MGNHDEKFTPGHKIHRLAFVRHAEPRPRPDGRVRQFVVLDCDCGTRVERDRSAWVSGRQKSCGCYGEETRHMRRRTHGMARTPIYQAWASMKQRSTPGTAANRHGNYGGVGRDPRWDTFEGFLAHQPSSGRRFRQGMQLSRIGDRGDYTPENTRWLTPAENRREMLKRRKLTLPDGRFAADVARESGIPTATWEHRYYSMGVDMMTAVTVRDLREA